MLRVIARLNMGGPAHQAALLSGRRFFPDRYETLLVHGRVPSGERSAAYLSEREGARMVHLPNLVQPLDARRDPLALLQLRQIIRRYRPDVIHTHTAKAGLLGRAAALLPDRHRPRLIHTFHGHVLEGYFGPYRSALYRGIERSLGRRTDRLVGVSQATVDDLVRLGVADRERFRVVRLGLDLDPFIDADPSAGRELRRALGIDADDVLCTFVGRLATIKRVELLIEALAAGREADPRLKLMIVGDGERRSALERVAEQLEVPAAVHFTGYREDLVSIWAASDIAVLSSANEGTPVSLLEAAAARVPAVATDVGGVREALSPEASTLVRSRSAPELGAALVALAADREGRLAAGEAARDHVAARFGAERLLVDIDLLYRELAAEAD